MTKFMAMLLTLALIGMTSLVMAQSSNPPGASPRSMPSSQDCPPGATVTQGDKAQTAAPPAGTSSMPAPSGSSSPSVGGSGADSTSPSGSGTARTTNAPSLGSGTQAQAKC